MVPLVFSLSSLDALFAQIASTVFPRGATVQNCSRSTINAGASRELTTIPRTNRPRLSGYRPTQKGRPQAPHRDRACAVPYLILDSRNSTCFLATGSYFFMTSLSVMVREFLRVT